MHLPTAGEPGWSLSEDVWAVVPRGAEKLPLLPAAVDAASLPLPSAVRAPLSSPERLWPRCTCSDCYPMASASAPPAALSAEQAKGEERSSRPAGSLLGNGAGGGTERGVWVHRYPPPPGALAPWSEGVYRAAMPAVH